MIIHTVMWKFKAEAEGRTREQNMLMMQEMLLALPEYIPQIRMLDAGIQSLNQEGAWDMVLITGFMNVQDLQIYQEDSVHVKVKQFAAKVTEQHSWVDYQTRDQGCGCGGDDCGGDDECGCDDQSCGCGHCH